MALRDDILALRDGVWEGVVGHRTDHATLHAGLKNILTRVEGMESRVALSLDTTVGTRVFAGSTMIHGDTGIRNLHSTTTPPLSGTGNVFLSRVGDRVYLEIGQYRADTTSGGKTLFKIPAGFRPSGNQFSLPVTDRDSSTLYSIDVLANGDVVEIGTPPPGRLYALITWATKQAWPVTLPGLPA